MRIKNHQDFWAGVLFIVVGGLFAGFGSGYQIGSAAQMGAGYFPTMLGVVMICIGLYVAASAVSPRAQDQKVKPFAWSTLLLILGPVVLFGLLLEPMGLVFCIVMVVGIASRASHEFSWRGTVVNAAVLVALCMGVFVYALDLQFPIWPAMFSA